MNIIIPESAKQTMQMEDDEKQRVREIEYREKVRKVIKDALLNMSEKLGVFEQACIGTIYDHGCSLGNVIDHLVMAYNRPDKVNLCYLDSCIRGFCK